LRDPDVRVQDLLEVRQGQLAPRDLDDRFGSDGDVCEPSGMPSTIWTGSISFGLVAVPVRVISATKSLDVRFNQLEEGTNARIRYRKISEATGDEVSNDRIQKGYEI